MVTAKRGAIPLAELRDIATKRSDLSGRASSALRAEMAKAVKPAKTIEHKGRVTRTATKSSLLDIVGLGGYAQTLAEEGVSGGVYGTSGIYPSRGTAEYTQGLVGMTRPEPDYPWWMDTWNATPGPAQWGAKKGGGLVLKGLESLAIPLSMMQATSENLAVIAWAQLDRDSLSRNEGGRQAYNELWEMAHQPNKLKAFWDIFADTYKRKESGSHDFMYGQGDIYNTFNIWQGERGTDQEWEWWANRGTALLSDIRMDPLFLSKTFGGLAKQISRGLKAPGMAGKLGKQFTRQKLDDAIRPLFKAEARAGGVDLPSRAGAKAGEITEQILADGRRIFVGEPVGAGLAARVANATSHFDPATMAARRIKMFEDQARVAKDAAKAYAGISDPARRAAAVGRAEEQAAAYMAKATQARTAADAARVSQRLAPTAAPAADAAAATNLWRDAITARLADDDFVMQVARDLNENTSRLVMREGNRVFVNFATKFGEHRKLAETLGNKVLKVEIPKSAADDIGNLANYLLIGSREGPLKMTNEGYRVVAKAMHEVGMDPFFNLGKRTLLNGMELAADPNFRKVGGRFQSGRLGKEALAGAGELAPISASEAANVGFKIGFAVPFTGSLGRKIFINPVRKRLMGMMALQDPVPMLAWSASNKYLGRPLVVANNAMRKMFVGRGHRLTAIGLGGKQPEMKQIIRKSKDPWAVVNAKTVVLDAGLGSQMHRSVEQSLHRMFTEVKNQIQAHPRLARDHPDGGAVLMRAVWGDEEAMRIVQEAAGDELFDEFLKLLPKMADEIERKAGRKFLGRANNYGPRKITKEARDHLANQRPGSVLRRHKRKPYDAGPHELDRKYIDQDEYRALVKKYISDGLEPEAAEVLVAKMKSDEIFGVKLHAVNSILEDGSKAPSVEKQIAKIMDDMDIGYSLFVEDWYEVMPSYISGMAKRAGEVHTEHLLVDVHGLFKDRMSVMAQVPSKHVMGRWTMVMRAQLNLKHQAAAVSETLLKIAKATKSEMKHLEAQLVERNGILDLAEEAYERAKTVFDVDALAVQKAEAHAMTVRNEVEALQVRIVEITNDLKAGDVSKAVLLEQERVKLVEKLATLRADPSVPKFYLESLRSSTVGQLQMEHRIHDVFYNMETFEAFEKIFVKWDPAMPLTKTNLYDFMVKNQDNLGLVGSLDIIPDTKQFVLRLESAEAKLLREQAEVGTKGQKILAGLKKEAAEKEYKDTAVLRMLKGANSMLDDLDSTPLGSWLGVETSPSQQAGTLSGLRLRQYSNVYRSIKQHTERSTAILQDWITYHPAVWKGKIPTPENVEKARIGLVRFTDNAMKMGQTFDDAMAEIGAESVLREYLHTYYGVHDDLNMMNMTNFGTIDNIVDQMETAVRLRYHDIEKALDEFRAVTFEIRVGPGEHGVRTLGIEEYAKYQRLKEAALQSRYSAQVPLPPAQHAIDDILTDGTKVAANGSGEAGVVGGTHPGGKYLINTPTGPKEFYAKQYGADRDVLIALQKEADDVAEFIQEGLFHEARDLPEDVDYRSQFGPLLAEYKRTGSKQIFVHDHLIAEQVRDQALDHLEAVHVAIAKQAESGKLRAEGEVLANALYREVGGDVSTAPISYASYSRKTSSWWVVSEWMDGLMPVGVVGQPHEVAQTMRMYMKGGGLPRLVTEAQAAAVGPEAAENIRPIYDMLGDNYLTDVLLANWNLVGDDVEKIALSQSGRLVRVDNGGVFRFHGRGTPKSADAKWDPLDIVELEGFRKTDQAGSYGAMAAQWEAAVNETEAGIVAALSSQFVQLDEVRKSYGGWEGFVRKHLPDIQSSGEAEYSKFLEQRWEVLAEKLGEKYNTGMELAAEVLRERGVAVADIERVMNRFGPTQQASKTAGYRPWLSPDQSSQGLDTFKLAEARKMLAGDKESSGLTLSLAARKARHWKESILDETQSWLDGVWGSTQNWIERMPFAEVPGDMPYDVAHLLADDAISGAMYHDVVLGELKKEAHVPAGWKSHTFDPVTGDFVEAWKPRSVREGGRSAAGEKTPQYGVIILDPSGDFILRMPSNTKSGAAPAEGRWNFPRSAARTWTDEFGVKQGETPAQAAIRAVKEQMDLDVELLQPIAGHSSKDPGGLPGRVIRDVEGGALYAEVDEDLYFYIAKIPSPDEGVWQALVGEALGTVASARTRHRISTFGVNHVTPMTSDPETIRQVMTLFHHSPGTQMIDPAGVNVGGTSVGWPDAWGLNMSPGAIHNRVMRDGSQTYAIDVNVGMMGERVRTYGIPTHLNARAVAAARSQNISAGQSTLDEGLAAFTRDMIGPDKNKPYYRLDSHNLVADGDMSVDMFGRVHDFDPQLYEELRVYFKKFYRTTFEPGADPMWGVNRDIPEGVSNLSMKMDLLDDLSKYNIPALDAMDYQTKALFVAHLEDSGRMYRPAEWPVKGVLKMGDEAGKSETDVMEGIVVDFLALIDEKLNPVDAWAFKSKLLTEPGLFPADLQRARLQLAKAAGGEWPTGQAGIMPGVGRQPVLGRGEALIPESPAAATERVRAHPEDRGWKSVRREGPESIGGSMRYDRFIETYRRSMMVDGYTTAAWLNPESFRMGKTLISDPKIGAFNAVLIDPMAAGVTPRSIKHVEKQGPWARGKGRAGVDDAGILNIDQFLRDYQRRSDEQLLGSSIGRSKVSPDDPIETLYEQRVRAAFDLDGPGGAMEQLKAAEASLKEAHKVLNETRLARAAAKSETRAAKATKYKRGEPAKSAITKRALEILNAENLRPSAGRPAGRPDLKTESLRNAFAGSDKQLRAEARAQLLQRPVGAEGVSKIKELETLLSQAGKRVQAAETANTILHRLGTVDKFGRSIPLEDLSTEIRNLKVSVGALIDADAQYINAALKELDRGADAAKWLRQVGEYGDDEIWFPLKKGFRNERYLDFSFEAGWKPFGYSSQGPAEMVESLTTVSRWRGGATPWGKFIRYYDKVHNIVKAYLIMKPGFHMRNYFSAVFMNHLAGVQVQNYRKFQNAYWNYQHDHALEMGLKNRASHLEGSLKKRLIWKKASPEDVAIIRRMDDAGILGGAQGQIGTEQVMAGGPKGNTKLKRALQAINPFSSRNAPLRLSKNAGMGVETFVRGTMGFDSMKAGNGVEVAFERIMKFHFDYSDLSHFEAGVVKRLVPFYTWTRKNLPLMIEQIGANPSVFNQYNIIKKNIESDDPITDLVPDWMIRQGGIQLPFKYKGENMWILPDLPFKTPLEMLDPILSLDSASPADRIEAGLSTMSTQLTPIFKGPLEWAMNRNYWKGYNFTGRWVRVPTVYTKVPGLIPALRVAQITEKNNEGDWYMRDRDMHVMGMMIPVLSDIRRLIPTEERYQQRALSTWMSWWAGLGLRTNTREEQERTLNARIQEMEDERAKMYKRRAAGLKP